MGSGPPVRDILDQSVSRVDIPSRGVNVAVLRIIAGLGLITVGFEEKVHR